MRDSGLFRQSATHYMVAAVFGVAELWQAFAYNHPNPLTSKSQTNGRDGKGGTSSFGLLRDSPPKMTCVKLVRFCTVSDKTSQRKTGSATWQCWPRLTPSSKSEGTSFKRARFNHRN